jgi:hypothetical protein
MGKVDPLPNGDYFSLIAFVAKGSDFTLGGAVARLQAALPGRVVRGIPVRRDRRVLAPWGGDQIVGFFIEVAPGSARRRRPTAVGEEDAPASAGYRAAAQRACEVLSGFRGVGVYDLGQGEAVLRQR